MRLGQRCADCNVDLNPHNSLNIHASVYDFASRHILLIGHVENSAVTVNEKLNALAKHRFRPKLL